MNPHLFVSLLLSLSVLSPVLAQSTDKVLAKCPEAPEVDGYFYNNGRVCVRDKETWNRETVPAVCADDNFKLEGNWCRRRFHRKVAPVCQDADYQLYKGRDGGAPTCQSPCTRPGTQPYNGVCVQPRKTLSPHYMTCDDSNDTSHSHRHGAYCCSMELGNCPQPECRIDTGGKGTFYYNPHNAQCERAAQVLPRTVSPKLPDPNNPKRRKCPAGKVSVRSNACQDPCPAGYRAARGKCVLPYCAFDTSNANSRRVVECPEGSYALAQDLY